MTEAPRRFYNDIVNQAGVWPHEIQRFMLLAFRLRKKLSRIFFVWVGYVEQGMVPAILRPMPRETVPSTNTTNKWPARYRHG